MSAALFATLAAASALAASWLAGSRWPWRAPRPAILLWQSIGLSWGLALVGTLLAFGLMPYESGVLVGMVRLGHDVAEGQPRAALEFPHWAAIVLGLGLLVVLLGSLVTATVRVIAARRRHRALLTLVARGDPGAPGMLVLDHPAAAAYCVPGVRARFVVSAGALRLLNREELAAVLAHEHAHARERHDLVLLPFTALHLAFGWVRWIRDAIDTVALLVEMRADDGARRHHAERLLALALVRLGSQGQSAAPAGALGAGDEVVTRVRRLLEPPRPLPVPAKLCAFGAALAFAGAPLLLLTCPA